MSDETSIPAAEGSGSDSSPVIPPADPEVVSEPQSTDPVAPIDPVVVEEPAPIKPIPAEPPKVSPPGSNSSPLPPVPDFRTRIKEAKHRKREVKLERILAYVREKGKVTNDEVQKLLRVSDATATRYLHELVKRGLLQKGGATRAIYYFPK